ncbi:MAG: TA system VapC family ribonuclease toxin [Actinomycetota bacterium]
MSATLDANLLLFASDASSPFHDRARAFLEELAEGPEIVYLFWPVVMAYIRIATHASIFQRPLSPEHAMANVEALLALSHVQSPGEQDRLWTVFRAVAEPAVVRGNLVPGALLVTLMRQNDVATIYSRDRDFRRFDGIDVIDPLA